MRHYPDWGPAAIYSVTLEATCLLSDLLSHIYVLIPVLDNNKHYWIGDDEVEKLLKRVRAGDHSSPARIYCSTLPAHRPTLIRNALARLLPEEAIAQEEEPRSRKRESQDREEPYHSPMMSVWLRSSIFSNRVEHIACWTGLRRREAAGTVIKGSHI